MAEDYEIHVQEGFTGETVDIRVNGAEVSRFAATTRPQIGLAHIERLQLSPGDTVQISIQASGTSVIFIPKPKEIYVRVNLVQKKLEINLSRSSPGYL
jgi:protein involved in polysaccharide export with SLBB domain